MRTFDAHTCGRSSICPAPHFRSSSIELKSCLLVSLLNGSSCNSVSGSGFVSFPSLGSLLGVDARSPSVSDSGSVLEFGVIASLFTAGTRRYRMEILSSWGMMRDNESYRVMLCIPKTTTRRSRKVGIYKSDP